MARGIDRVFEVPVLGHVLRLLFLERTHILLAAVCAIGGLLWLFNLWMGSPTLAEFAFWVMSIPLALFGILFLLALSFAALDKLFFNEPAFGFSERSLREAIRQGISAGELEVSIRFNSATSGFVLQATSVTVEVTGGQEADIRQEIVDAFRAQTDRPIEVRPGANRWRRRILFPSEAGT